jgi:hypothetical protein
MTAFPYSHLAGAPPDARPAMAAGVEAEGA